MTPSLAVANAFEKSRPYVDNLVHFDSFSQSPPADVVKQICASLWDRKGKRLRSHFVYWFGEMAGVAPRSLELYAWAAEAIHTATLLHDDVIDEARVRRGGPSANIIYGNTLPILSGDYLMSDAVQRIAESGDSQQLAGLCQALKFLVCGESIQYEMRYCVPESERVFWRIAELKTTSLLRWAAMVGPKIGKCSWQQVVHDFMDEFGALFQFSDDLLDVVGSEDKDRWLDLKEGKLNYVSWQLLSENPALKESTKQIFDFRRVDKALLQAYQNAATPKFIKSIHKKLEKIAGRAKSHLELLPPSEIRFGLEGLVDLCVERTR